MSHCSIRVRNLVYSYADKEKVLNGVNLEVEHNESVALIGPNGAGKSTLFLQFIGLLTPHSGELEVCGIQLRDEASREEVRRKVGLVFQNPQDQLFCPTVYDDVAFGPINHDLNRKQVEQQVTKALDAVGMAKVKNRPSHHLSFGEQRLVAIATALASEPDLILFDEPSSNLDPRSHQHLVKLINKMPQTKIIATHDFGLALATCSRVIVLHEGRITDQGTPEKLLYNEKLLQKNGLELPYLMKQKG